MLGSNDGLREIEGPIEGSELGCLDLDGNILGSEDGSAELKTEGDELGSAVGFVEGSDVVATTE